jgi:hypothetical protein
MAKQVRQSACFLVRCEFPVPAVGDCTGDLDRRAGNLAMGQFERRIRVAASGLFRVQPKAEVRHMADGKETPAVAVYEYSSKPGCDIWTGEVV